MKKHYTLLAAGLVLVLGSACVHGVLTNRWGQPVDLSIAAAQLDKLPHIVGDWHSQPLEVPESQLEGAEAVGHFSRLFRNDKTQTQVQVMVLCGAHGPIAVHPPTICFQGAGYRQTDPEKAKTVNAGDVKGTFWNTVFIQRTPDGVTWELDTYWAWSTHGECEASENPRVQYASSPHLYKIYVTHRRLPSNADASKSACEEFLKVFLPAFRATLSDT